MILRSLAILAVAVVFCGSLAGQNQEVIRLGMVNSMTENLSPGKKDFVNNEFVTMIKDFTGLKGKVILGAKVDEIAKKLDADEWDFAVVHGVEYAWLQKLNPKVKPLMVAVYKEPAIHALLVTAKESKVSGFADLKGKDISMISRVDCELFVEKHVKSEPAKYFGAIMKTTSAEDALDAILLGKVQASVVDSSSLGIYKDINPGRFNRLKVLAKSEAFPVSVVAYQEGKVNDKVLTNFREGMLKANTSEKGKEAMATFKINSFQNVPSTFQEEISAILKAYPPTK